MKPTPVQEKIISLLRSSPELCEFLLASPEKLQTADYANIIAGAPISLWAKRELLGELEASLTDSGDAEFVHRYVTCLDAALQSMTRPAGEALIDVGFFGADRIGEYTYISYYTHSWNVFAEILRTIRAEAEYEDDWDIEYWRIKQYDLKAADSFQRYDREDYTFLADINGEIQYFIHGHDDVGATYEQPEAAFCGNSNERSLPVPYQPGDILEIDCRPYRFGPVYSIMLTADSPGCAAQYLYQPRSYEFRIVPLEKVEYCDTYVPQQSYLTAVYHVRRYSGELPEECSWMKALSSKIQAEPSFGETIAGLKGIIGLCPIKRVKRSEMK